MVVVNLFGLCLWDRQLIRMLSKSITVYSIEILSNLKMLIIRKYVDLKLIL